MTMSTTPDPFANRVVHIRRAANGVDALCRRLAADSTLPMPPSERCFIGDGDFRAIGAEFLGHFVRLGGLRPYHRVLEIGCGIGRMAVPLSRFLTDTYDGVDVVADGIRWCRETITPRHPNFRFHHLDVVNDLYNPGGSTAADAVTLPFLGQSFDFVILTSVVTHLRTAEAARYVVEIGRLLRPGGRCFLSLFLVDGTVKRCLAEGRSRLPFPADGAGPEHIADASAPNAAVAYDERFLLGLFAAQRLTPAQPPLHGHWSGRNDAANFQDLLVLEKGGGR